MFKPVHSLIFLSRKIVRPKLTESFPFNYMLKSKFSLSRHFEYANEQITYHFWLWLVEQELLTLPEHLSSPPVFSGVRVTRSLVLYVCVPDRCLSFCAFSFGHCVFSSSIYGFWLSLWYLQTLLVNYRKSCPL